MRLHKVIKWPASQRNILNHGKTCEMKSLPGCASAGRPLQFSAKVKVHLTSRGDSIDVCLMNMDADQLVAK